VGGRLCCLMLSGTLAFVMTEDDHEVIIGRIGSSLVPVISSPSRLFASLIAGVAHAVFGVPGLQAVYD